MSRLPSANRETFPEELKYVWDRLEGDTTAGDGTGTANIFRAMGNNPRILLGYLRLANPLWAHCGLDVKTREIVILRAAYVQNSAYEWHQHVTIGRNAGLTDAQINATLDPAASTVLAENEKALCAYVDAMAVSNHPGDVVYNALRKHYDDAAMVGITILIAFYFATAKFLGAMEVETEVPFIGWVL
jgi:4-carboxymuconolactone decarboxylase